MARPSFVRDGLRAVVREPALFLTEIAWRWAFGLVTWLLLALSLRQVLAGVNLSETEYQMARQSDVFLIADALARALRDVLPELVRALIILTPCVALVWIVVASIGRWSTTKVLLETFPVQEGAEVPAASEMTTSGRFRSLVALNFLRVVFTLAAILAWFGLVILASRLFISPDLAMLGVLVGLFLAVLVGFAWSVVNWFLALAPIYIVRDGLDAVQATGESLGLFRRRGSHYLNIAIGYSVLRFLLLVAVLLLSVAPASLYSSDAWRAVLAICLPLALGYFAVADFLQIAKLGSYVELANAGPDPEPAQWQPLPIPGAPEATLEPQEPVREPETSTVADTSTEKTDS